MNQDVEKGKVNVTPSSPVAIAKYTVLCSIGFFVAMLIHDGTQEFLVNKYGKTSSSGKWLGFLDCLGCFVGAYFSEPVNFLKDIFSKKQRDRTEFLLLTILVYGSVGAANVAITKISYPIKVIGKSCKLIPTMIVSTLIFKGKKFKPIEYIFACSMCLGLAGFAYVTNTSAKKSGVLSSSSHYNGSSLFGMLLLALAVSLDAVTPNIQERVMKNGRSSLYVMGNVNFYCSIVSFVIFIFSNGAYDVVYTLMVQPDVLLVTLFCTSSTFIGVACYLKLE